MLSARAFSRILKDVELVINYQFIMVELTISTFIHNLIEDSFYLYS